MAALSVAALVLGGAQAAGTPTAAGFDGAQLTVDYAAFGGQSFLALTLNLQDALASGGIPPVAAAVQIAVPVGFQLEPNTGQCNRLLALLHLSLYPS